MNADGAAEDGAERRQTLRVRHLWNIPCTITDLPLIHPQTAACFSVSFYIISAADILAPARFTSSACQHAGLSVSGENTQKSRWKTLIIHFPPDTPSPRTALSLLQSTWMKTITVRLFSFCPHWFPLLSPCAGMDGRHGWMCVLCVRRRGCAEMEVFQNQDAVVFFMQTCPEKQQVGCHDLKPDSKGSFLGNAHSATPLIGRWERGVSCRETCLETLKSW